MLWCFFKLKIKNITFAASDQHSEIFRHYAKSISASMSKEEKFCNYFWQLKINVWLLKKLVQNYDNNNYLHLNSWCHFNDMLDFQCLKIAILKRKVFVRKIALTTATSSVVSCHTRFSQSLWPQTTWNISWPSCIKHKNIDLHVRGMNNDLSSFLTKDLGNWLNWYT